MDYTVLLFKSAIEDIYGILKTLDLNEKAMVHMDSLTELLEGRITVGLPIAKKKEREDR